MTNKKQMEDITGFIKILVIVVLFIGLIYALTTLIVNKNEKKKEEAKETVNEINHNEIVAGSMFNLNYNEYYVVLYKNSSNMSSLLNSLATTYRSAPNTIPLFNVNLDDGLNKKYYNPTTTNSSPLSVEDISVGDYTLIKFKNGKVVSYYESIEKIKEILEVE